MESQTLSPSSRAIEAFEGPQPIRGQLLLTAPGPQDLPGYYSLLKERLKAQHTSDILTLECKYAEIMLRLSKKKQMEQEKLQRRYHQRLRLLNRGIIPKPNRFEQRSKAQQKKCDQMTIKETTAQYAVLKHRSEIDRISTSTMHNLGDLLHRESIEMKEDDVIKSTSGRMKDLQRMEDLQSPVHLLMHVGRQQKNARRIPIFQLRRASPVPESKRSYQKNLSKLKSDLYVQKHFKQHVKRVQKNLQERTGPKRSS